MKVYLVFKHNGPVLTLQKVWNSRELALEYIAFRMDENPNQRLYIEEWSVSQ